MNTVNAVPVRNLGVAVMVHTVDNEYATRMITPDDAMQLSAELRIAATKVREARS